MLLAVAIGLGGERHDDLCAMPPVAGPIRVRAGAEAATSPRLAIMVDHNLWESQQ
jgi:hypothetical protein